MAAPTWDETSPSAAPTWEDTAPPEGPQWSDLPKNIVAGIKEAPATAMGILDMADKGMAINSPVEWARSGAQALRGQPFAETRVGEALGTVKEMAGQMADDIKGLPQGLRNFAQHPGQSIKEHIIEHPIGSAVDAASIVLPMLRGPAEVGGRYAGRFAENQMGKLHGTTRAQFRELGRENFGNVMRASFEKGDADFGLGSIGREQMINERIAGLGDEIGSLRAQADAAGRRMSPQQMATQIRQQVEKDFMPGGKYYDEQGAFQQGLENIRKMPEGGIENFAQRASDIRTEAAGKKLRLPVNADTQIANQMARINDENIARRLGAEAGEHYELLKDEFGAAKALKPMEAVGEAKEALSNAPHTLFGAVKDIAHTMVGGPKLGANLGFGAEGLLGDVAQNAGMYGAGGLASATVSQYVNDKYNPAIQAKDIHDGPEGIIRRIINNPVLSRYGPQFQQAAQRGPQAITAEHFILMQRDPAYNKAFTQDEDGRAQ